VGIGTAVSHASERDSSFLSFWHGRVGIGTTRDRLQTYDSLFFSSSMQSVTSHLAIMHEFNMYLLIFQYLFILGRLASTLSYALSNKSSKWT
jgi:hypothetical protein